MLDIANYAVLIAAAITAIASVAIFVLSRSAERDKERAFEAYKTEASQKTALAHEGAEKAKAEAEVARADAARAKLETAEVSERLAITQERLDAANTVIPLTSEQIAKIVAGMTALPLEGSQPVAAAANDLQAQRRLLQLTNAFTRADRTLYLQGNGSMVVPDGERGEVMVHYWADNRKGVAEAIAKVFRHARLETNVYWLPYEGDDASRTFQKNAVLIGFGPRVGPSFRQP